MGEDAAEEWLAVAMAELVGYWTQGVLEALASARRHCTHHSQIVPHVMKHLDDAANRWSYTGRKEIPRVMPKLAEPPREIAGLITNAAKLLRADRP